MGEHRDAGLPETSPETLPETLPEALLETGRPADLHGGRWRAAQDRAAELIEPRFSEWSAGWGWSSYHLGRDLVAIAVFVLAHQRRCAAERIAGVDVAALLGEAARRHWSEAQSEAWLAEATGRRPQRRLAFHWWLPGAHREHARGLELWHAARAAQTETLQRRLVDALSAAGVDLQNDEDTLVRTWRWLTHVPEPPFSDDDGRGFAPAVRQEYLREAAEYAIRLLALPWRDLTGGRTVSDLDRDGWWRGRVEVDETGRVYVAEEPEEEPTRPGEPHPSGAARGAGSNVTVMRATGVQLPDTPPDTAPALTEIGPPDILVADHRDNEHGGNEHNSDEQGDEQGDADRETVAAAVASLAAAWERAPAARMVLMEYRPGWWDVLWRPDPHRSAYQHVEIESFAPFAAEVIGAAFLGWHEWRATRPDQQPHTSSGWSVASTVPVRVPALAEWMPITMTPEDAPEDTSP